MGRSQDEIESLVKTFTTFTMHPPETAVFAFASLLAGDTLAAAIGESFTVEKRTVWDLIGITDASLIRVHASSACDCWSWTHPGSDDQQRGEDIVATLWPLSALRSLKVARVGHDTTGQKDSAFEWDAAWVVTLLGGEEVSVPASEMIPSRADRERVESLIAVIRTHI
jgi:hypothetical protein